MSTLWTEMQALGMMYISAAVELVWPFLVAVLVSASLTTARFDTRVVPLFERSKVWRYGGALLLGLMSPFWALGVLPAVAGLLAAGLPLTPVMIFLATSPLMSPSAFLITLGGLGWPFALGKLASAVAVGVLVGLSTETLLHTGWLRGQVQPDLVKHVSPLAGSTWSTTARAGRGRAFLQLCGRTTLFIGKFIAGALVFQVVMRRYVPAAWIHNVLGTDNPFSVLIAAAIGLPTYLNSNAAIPLLKGLLDLGMNRGAALAFLVAGPMICIPSLIAIMALVRWRAVALLLGVGFLGAVFSGYVFAIL